MRLTDVEARELLSFDTLQLTGLPQTLVVVGPNGAGETNLLRLLQIVLVAIDRAATFSQFPVHLGCGVAVPVSAESLGGRSPPW